MNVGIGVEGKEEALTEGRCGTCAKAEPVKIKGEPCGFVRCGLRKRWEWISGKEPCQFDPVRWVA